MKIKSSFYKKNLWKQPCNAIWIKHLNRLITQREKLLLYGQNRWANYSRKQWLTQGDRNTRFFHNPMKQKIASTINYRLKNEFDHWVDDHDEISKLLTSSFQKQFQSTATSPRTIDLSFIRKIVTTDDISSLLAPVSKDEIKKCIFRY